MGIFIWNTIYLILCMPDTLQVVPILVLSLFLPFTGRTVFISVGFLVQIMFWTFQNHQLFCLQSAAECYLSVCILGHHYDFQQFAGTRPIQSALELILLKCMDTEKCIQIPQSRLLEATCGICLVLVFSEQILSVYAEHPFMLYFCLFNNTQISFYSFFIFQTLQLFCLTF